MKGYVYVLINEAMPGLVKIGRSQTAAAGRARTMYRGDTGVPLPFDIYFECMFDDCVSGEQSIHEELDCFRINPKREFFRMNPEDAAVAVLRVRAYDAQCTVQLIDMTVDEPTIHTFANDLQEHPFNIVMAIEFMKAEELRPGMDRWIERRERGRKPDPSVICCGCGEEVTAWALIQNTKYCEDCFRYVTHVLLMSGGS